MCVTWRSKSAAPSGQRRLFFQGFVKLLIPLRGRSSRRGELRAFRSPPPAVEGSFDLLTLPPAFGIRQPVALAVGFQDVHALGQTVQQCTRQPFTAQHFSPLFKG